jgi:hypothetical protein
VTKIGDKILESEIFLLKPAIPRIILGKLAEYAFEKLQPLSGPPQVVYPIRHVYGSTDGISMLIA